MRSTVIFCASVFGFSGLASATEQGPASDFQFARTGVLVAAHRSPGCPPIRLPSSVFTPSLSLPLCQFLPSSEALSSPLAPGSSLMSSIVLPALVLQSPMLLAPSIASDITGDVDSAPAAARTAARARGAQ